MLTDDSFIAKKSLDTVYFLYKLGGEATCTQISDNFGNVPGHYNANAIHLAKLVCERTQCILNTRENEEGDRYWAVLFQGKYAWEEDK